MGKWARRAVKGLVDTRFWLCLRISSQISSALDLLFWSVVSVKMPRDDSFDVKHFGNLARLVLYKAEEIHEQLSAMLSDEFWASTRSWYIDASTDGANAARFWDDYLSDGIRKVVLKVIAEFKRRVLDVVQSYPWKLMWFACTDPDAASDTRLRLAKELLDTPLEQLHSAAKKCLAVFKRDLIYCVVHQGKVTGRMYSIIRYICLKAKADTQEIEGIMSLIKLAVKRCSSQVSLQYVDAMVGIIKHLGMGTRASKPSKWSGVKDEVDEMVHTAVEHAALGIEVQSNLQRWALPPPDRRIIPPFALQGAPPLGQLCIQWSSSHSLMLRRAYMNNSYIKNGSAAIVVYDSSDALVSSWVLSSTHRYTSSLTAINMSGVAEADIIQIPDNIVTTNSVALFESLFTSVMTGSTYPVRFAPIKLPLNRTGCVQNPVPALMDEGHADTEDSETQDLRQMVLSVTKELPIKPKRQSEPLAQLRDISDAAGDAGMVFELDDGELVALEDARVGGDEDETIADYLVPDQGEIDAEESDVSRGVRAVAAEANIEPASVAHGEVEQ